MVQFRLYYSNSLLELYNKTSILVGFVSKMERYMKKKRKWEKRIYTKPFIPLTQKIPLWLSSFPTESVSHDAYRSQHRTKWRMPKRRLVVLLKLMAMLRHVLYLPDVNLNTTTLTKTPLPKIIIFILNKLLCQNIKQKCGSFWDFGQTFRTFCVEFSKDFRRFCVEFVSRPIPPPKCGVTDKGLNSLQTSRGNGIYPHRLGTFFAPKAT